MSLEAIEIQGAQTPLRALLHCVVALLREFDERATKRRPGEPVEIARRTVEDLRAALAELR